MYQARKKKRKKKKVTKSREYRKDGRTRIILKPVIETWM